MSDDVQAVVKDLIMELQDLRKENIRLKLIISQCQALVEELTGKKTDD